MMLFPPVRRPNVLWVSFEDTSPRFGCYGDPVALTPNIDRLAAAGRLYARAFSVAGVCSPSRSAIITGLYPPSAGTHHHRTSYTNVATPGMATPYEAVLPHYAKLLPEYLRHAGYYCSNNVKTDYQFIPPFTAWDDCSKSGHWRNRPNPEQPFFAVFNLESSHESGMWEDKGAPRKDPNSLNLPPWVPDTPKCREALARQYDHIEDNDALLGRLLQQLEEDGIADNTIVMLWSDHGEGVPRSKRYLYDSGTRIPLIVKLPGEADPGCVCEDLISLIDLAPTVLSLCGQRIPQHMQGQVFLGFGTKRREFVFGNRDRLDESYSMARSVRDRRFRYIRNYSPERPFSPWTPYQNRHPMMQEMWRLYLAGELTGPQLLIFETSRPVEELYDLEHDPHELKNLAEDLEHGAELKRLRTALEGWLKEIGDLGEIDEIEIKNRWWNGPEQPATAAPVFVAVADNSPGIEPAVAENDLQGQAAVLIHSATQGASIGWTASAELEPAWKLYTGPIRLENGVTSLRAKAIRIGFLPSEEAAARFTVR